MVVVNGVMENVKFRQEEREQMSDGDYKETYLLVRGWRKRSQETTECAKCKKDNKCWWLNAVNGRCPKGMCTECAYAFEKKMYGILGL